MTESHFKFSDVTLGGLYALAAYRDVVITIDGGLETVFVEDADIEA